MTTQSIDSPDEGGARPGKNIVVMSDGTGQEGGYERNTNVYKLFNMLEARTPNQVAFYDAGLGTGFRKVTGMASGMGISRNIREGYKFIFDNYQAGDRIFLFGFSRGAATVRSLSGFIHHFGLLPQSRPDLIKRAWQIYRIRNPKTREEKADAFIKANHTMWAKIHVVCCYDTVAALGVPFKSVSGVIDQVPFFRHTFHNFELSESVEHAYHALAIDDMRKTFHPVLWKDDPRVHQVWFMGMHTDVGGGYQETGLSDIALTWMVDRAQAHGLRLFRKHEVPMKQDPLDVLHDSRGKWFTKIYRVAQRAWADFDGTARPGKPIVHESVLARAEATKDSASPYRPWIIEGDYDVEPWDPKRTPWDWNSPENWFQRVE